MPHIYRGWTMTSLDTIHAMLHDRAPAADVADVAAECHRPFRAVELARRRLLKSGCDRRTEADAVVDAMVDINVARERLAHPASFVAPPSPGVAAAMRRMGGPS